MDAISYLLYAPPLLPLPASLAASGSRISRSGVSGRFWQQNKQKRRVVTVLSDHGRSRRFWCEPPVTVEPAPTRTPFVTFIFHHDLLGNVDFRLVESQILNEKFFLRRPSRKRVNY